MVYVFGFVVSIGFFSCSGFEMYWNFNFLCLGFLYFFLIFKMRLVFLYLLRFVFVNSFLVFVVVFVIILWYRRLFVIVDFWILVDLEVVYGVMVKFEEIIGIFDWYLFLLLLFLYVIWCLGIKGMYFFLGEGDWFWVM